MFKSFIGLFLVTGLFCSAPLDVPQARAQEETEAAEASKLTSVMVPEGAVRLRQVPDEMRVSLAAIIKVAGPGVKQGNVEVLAWRGNGYEKGQAPELLTGIKSQLENVGYEVEIQDSGQDFQLVSVTRQQPRRAFIGVWVAADEAAILSWTEMLAVNPPGGTAQAASGKNNSTTSAKNGPPNKPTKTASTVQPVKASQSGKDMGTGATPTVIEVSESARTVNLMKNAMPRIPAFQALKPKKGYVRGFVKDANGKPLKGAKLGIRSTVVGGAYSGASGQTDAKGYYEFLVPFGACHFYNAGYTVSYGDGRAAMGLHPADGELDSFASNVGGVENFVLLAYGIADADEVQDNPQYANNYYGGDFVLSWDVMDDRPVFADPSDLPAHSTIELTLAPTSAMVDGKPGRAFVIRKKIGEGFGQLYVNNIPVSSYRLSARLVDGADLKMKEVGPNGGSAFGIEPKLGASTVLLQLRPSSAKAESATPRRGNWEHISISLKR
jgi:hypothetical protein